VGGVNPQKLLEDPEARVAGDIQREQARRANSPTAPERDQRRRQRQVEDELVEEGGMEGAVTLVARRPVGRVDLEPPRQRRRPAEQLLVEVVADPSDRLGDEQPGSSGIHECGDVHTRAAQSPEPGERAGGDPAPDPEAALPDRERAPPVVGHLVPARRDVVQPSADETRREPPHRDVVDELAPAALLLPAPDRDRDRSADPEHVHQPIRVHEQRPEVKAVARWAGDERETHCPARLEEAARAGSGSCTRAG